MRLSISIELKNTHAFFQLINKLQGTWISILYAMLIGTGFMVSPATRALGIGILGLQFKDGYQFLTTVILAHLAFGSIVGWFIYKKNTGIPNILVRLKKIFQYKKNVDKT